ncbi:sodium:proton antiporter [Rubrobacter indicoceani]|uniref:sodium:proton antiporter n=1 Tax=Rubrobacter indicoceani TaxID=2051957 RepID=UPI000E5B94DD|nr:NADH-quinone oxidoreductase subunit K [Rubrobacter indicoceani]
MNLALSLAIAVLFGAGATLLLKGDLIRIVVGTVLISNAANLFIMASGLSRGQAPLYPLQEGASVSDPLVQAMTLTAIVISFGITALLLSIAYRVYLSLESLESEKLEEAEEAEESEQERGEWRPV